MQKPGKTKEEQAIKLPYNIEIEQKLLGAVLIDERNYFKLNDITPDCFYEPLHQRIWAKFTDLYTKGHDLDPMTLTPYFENDEAIDQAGGTNYFLHLSGLAITMVNLKSYAKVLKELSRKRKLAVFLDKHAGKISMDTDVDAVLSEMEVISYEPSKTAMVKSEKELAIDILKSLEEKLPCHSTGLPLLDKALGGGFYEAKSYWLVGRGKAGKTACLGSLSHNQSKMGIPHLYVALEMGMKEIYQRVIAYNVQHNPIAFYDEETRNDDRFRSAVGKYAMQLEGSARYANAAGMKFSDLKRMIISEVRKYKLKGVYFDYLQIVKGKPKGESKADFLFEVAQWFADLTKQENIFFVGGAQMNKEGNVRDSEGATMAGDASIYLYGSNDDKNLNRWMKIRDSRYTMPMELGSETDPYFTIDPKGIFFKQYYEDDGKQKELIKA